ncbi:MAG: CHASE2 domain-containing protein, partial [Synechococcus sp.]|nr:CHASE2 domain-containing protein [Synechococcus sp.]
MVMLRMLAFQPEAGPTDEHREPADRGDVSDVPASPASESPLANLKASLASGAKGASAPTTGSVPHANQMGSAMGAVKTEVYTADATAPAKTAATAVEVTSKEGTLETQSVDRSHRQQSMRGADEREPMKAVTRQQQGTAEVLADLPEPHPAALAFALRPGPPPLAPLGIDFLGPAGTVPVVPAWTLPQLPAGFWRDRIVLIGATPSRLSDRRPSPFGPLSSVELQAAALATVLQRRGFQPLPGPLELLLLGSWAGLAVLWLGGSSTAIATATRALLQALLGLGLGGLTWLAGWWLPVAALALAPLLAGGGRALGQWRRESRERAYLHQVLARRVSPALLQDILRNPGPLGTQLGGSRSQCAVLFTDLVGFTPLSAQLEAAVLFDLLNRYFEAIAAAVIAEQGLLDKFIGDALMAEFGVPRSRGLAVETLAAVRAALAMQQALAALNQQLADEGLPPLRQGIGIHVGEVIAGNLGSSQRLEFTVVGASVNVASRLEG